MRHGPGSRTTKSLPTNSKGPFLGPATYAGKILITVQNRIELAGPRGTMEASGKWAIEVPAMADNNNSGGSNQGQQSQPVAQDKGAVPQPVNPKSSIEPRMVENQGKGK